MGVISLVAGGDFPAKHALKNDIHQIRNQTSPIVLLLLSFILYYDDEFHMAEPPSTGTRIDHVLDNMSIDKMELGSGDNHYTSYVPSILNSEISLKYKIQFYSGS